MGMAQDEAESAVGGIEEPKTPEAESAKGGTEEPKTPEAPHRSEGDGTTPRTPVVSMPDKQPSCPCSETWFTRMLGLIDHLKRAHGQRKIIFRCSKCGKQNLKYHTISCHIPRCKGVVCGSHWGMGL